MSDLVKLSDILKNDALSFAGADEGGGSPFYKTSNGVIKFRGQAIEGNTVVAIIVDAVYENDKYNKRWDPEKPEPPDCFAFGRDPRTMRPHKDSKKQLHTDCATCPANQFGSSKTGIGKDCKNQMRLALLQCGEMHDGRFVPDASKETYTDGEIGFLRTPVTSTKNFLKYAAQLASAGKPIYSVATAVQLVPDKKNQYSLTFTAVGALTDEILGAMIARRADLEIDFPYQYKKTEDNF